MAKEKETVLTAETFAAEYPEIHGELVKTAKADGKAEGEKALAERFTAIAELAPDDPEFAVAQFKAGVSVEDAKTALIARLREQKEQAPAQPTKPVDPAVTEFSDDVANTNKPVEKPKTPEEKFTAEFNADEKVQDEFGGAEGLANYISFRKAEEAGLVKVKSNR